MDNGSLEPASVLSLRRIADRLSEAIGISVHAVSLLHSHKIPGEYLGGHAAQSLDSFVRSRLNLGEHRFGIIPLFFGPGDALGNYLPERISRLKAKHLELELTIAPCLVDLKQDRGEKMAALLESQIRSVVPPDWGEETEIILVDHGSPKPDVTAVRDALALQLSARFGASVRAVVAASMERRPGPEYAFNEPLLKTVLEKGTGKARRIVLCRLFLSPGRHAGPDGDIAQICREACRMNPGLELVMTPLVGEHPGLIQILSERANGLLRPAD